ncbi:MAG: type II secretion system protein M [Moraxellaceae bacterium]|nr:type II secretion system protein M [Moraxellaceae bacterium]
MTRKKQNKFNQILQQISEKWHRLASRDKLALTVLLLFFFAFFGGYGGWQLHENAKKQQEKFDKKVSDYFWLRSQAGNLKEQNLQNGDSNNPPQQQITASFQQVGIQDAQVVANNDSVQFSFQHESPALVNHALTQLQNAGFQIQNLQMIQENANNQSVIKVQGVISLGGGTS